jgi:predicted CopG family antitoxin
MNTTICVTDELKNKIKEFGNKGDTYNDILTKLYKSAKERQIQDLLMDTTNCITIEGARKRLKKNA